MTNLKEIGEMLTVSQKNLAQAISAYQELVGGGSVKSAKYAKGGFKSKVKFASQEQGDEVRDVLRKLLTNNTVKATADMCECSDAHIYAILKNSEKRVKENFYDRIMKLTK